MCQSTTIIITNNRIKYVDTAKLKREGWSCSHEIWEKCGILFAVPPFRTVVSVYYKTMPSEAPSPMDCDKMFLQLKIPRPTTAEFFPFLFRIHAHVPSWRRANIHFNHIFYVRQFDRYRRIADKTCLEHSLIKKIWSKRPNIGVRNKLPFGKEILITSFPKLRTHNFPMCFHVLFNIFFFWSAKEANVEKFSRVLTMNIALVHPLCNCSSEMTIFCAFLTIYSRLLLLHREHSVIRQMRACRVAAGWMESTFSGSCGYFKMSYAGLPCKQSTAGIACDIRCNSISSSSGAAARWPAKPLMT